LDFSVVAGELAAQLDLDARLVVEDEAGADEGHGVADRDRGLGDPEEHRFGHLLGCAVAAAVQDQDQGEPAQGNLLRNTPSQLASQPLTARRTSAIGRRCPLLAAVPFAPDAGRLQASGRRPGPSPRTALARERGMRVVLLLLACEVTAPPEVGGALGANAG